MQIAAELRDYARNLRGVRILAIYGGSSIRFQLSELRRGVDIVVATPGRLLDVMSRRAVRFDAVRCAVLDEADEMLQMGFQEDIEEILSAMPETSHTWMFSATMGKRVATVAHHHLKDPIEITSTHRLATPNISHVCHTLHPSERQAELRGLIDRTPDFFGLVFRRTRRSAQELADTFTREGYPAAALHGDMSQPQRDRVMRGFRRRDIRVLIATDVAARGLDVDDVTHIVHYDLPDDPDIYTHRSGRTARAGKAGISIAYATPSDHPRIARFAQNLNVAFDYQGIPVRKDQGSSERRGPGGRYGRPFAGRAGRDFRPAGPRTRHAAHSFSPR
jgi:ATP-dependent RNA helicase DeaD